MNAARALRVARERAGLSQAGLARAARVDPAVVNRIERARLVPRVDTLERLLRSAGATLTVVSASGTETERGGIRDLLSLPMRARLLDVQLEALDELCRRRIWFVVVGNAAARLRGAPVAVEKVDLCLLRAELNLRKYARVVRPPIDAAVNVIATVRADAEVWRGADELPWLPAPTLRILNRWIDAPSGLVASIEYLQRCATAERRELLAAVQEEIDSLGEGLRVYRDPSRRAIRMPPPTPELRRRPHRRVQGMS